MKQTAVEWLINEIQTKHDKSFLDFYGSEIIQAKEMEKQQIIDACNFGYYEGCAYMSDIKSKYESFEQYYDEKFNKEI